MDGESRRVCDVGLKKTSGFGWYSIKVAEDSVEVPADLEIDYAFTAEDWRQVVEIMEDTFERRKMPKAFIASFGIAFAIGIVFGLLGAFLIAAVFILCFMPWYRAKHRRCVQDDFDLRLVSMLSKGLRAVYVPDEFCDDLCSAKPGFVSIRTNANASAATTTTENVINAHNSSLPQATVTATAVIATPEQGTQQQPLENAQVVTSPPPPNFPPPPPPPPPPPVATVVSSLEANSSPHQGTQSSHNSAAAVV